MKSLLISLNLSILFSLQACQYADDVASKILTIKSAAFLGIPAQNVNLDSQNHIITVKLPPRCPEVYSPLSTYRTVLQSPVD